MKTWLLVACLAAGGGEHEKGLALYREGRFAEAAAAFRAAIDSDGDSAELQYDLALASWRAGDLSAAETAAEKYAALAKNARADLHRGLLGAIRHDEAKLLEARAAAAGSAPPPAVAPGGTEPPPPEDPLPMLEQALAKANQGKEHFVAGAKSGTTPELLRNTERTLRYIDELQRKIDELKKQREEQAKDDDKKDEPKKDEPKKEDQPKDDQKQDEKSDPKKDEKSDKSDQQKNGEPQPGEQGDEKPEPKPEPQPQPEDGKSKPEPKDGADKPPEPKGEEQQPEPKPAEPRNDAPGENVEARELSPEQAQRLMEQLKDLDQKLRALRARAKSTRPPVERDW